MNLDQITTKCWILALFERDDGERLLLGDGWFDFKDSLQHFQPNTFANDVIELQGSDGQMLAGQVRRGAPQSFDGYIGDPITNRQAIEQHRREFLMFFRKRHHYKVVYIFPDGTAIQRKQGYITDAPSVPEIRQRFPEYHVALNFEDVNYCEYAENAQGEEIFSNIRDINISTAATGGLVWDNLGAVSDQMGWKDIATATGQMLAMTNPESIKAPIASFEMTGNIEQNGTPTPSAPVPIQTVTGEQTVTVAKNYLETYPTPSGTITVANVSITLNSNGTLALNGTCNGNGWVEFVQDFKSGTATQTTPVTNLDSTKTYTISAPVISGTVSGTSCGVNMQFSSSLESGASIGGSRTITGADGIYRAWVRLYSGAIFNNAVIAPMITEEAQTQEYEINLGKNLIEPKMPTWTYHGVTCTNNGDGSFTLNGTATATATWRISQSTANGHDNMLNLNGTYTLSCGGLQNGMRLVVTQFNVWQTVGAMNDNDTPATFTTSLNDLIIYVAVMNGTTVNNVTIYPQLERGSIASPYSPYFEPIELCKIGDYQDRIFKENGKWWLHKETGKVALTGSETIGKGGTTQNQYFYANVLSNYVKPSNNDQLVPHFSNRFVSKTPNQLSGGSVVGSAIRTDNAVGFAFGVNSEINTIDKCKTWLTNNPTTFYYVLATPTTTEITNEEILEGLNGAAGLKLFPDQNNITDQTPNAQPTMTVQYHTALGPGGGLVWESGEAGGATIIEASGLDSAFPLWTVPGPSTNPTLTNITTGQSITWQGTVPAGQTLEIDMDKQTATLAGANVYAFVSGDWIRIDPGSNRMTYVGTGATQASTLSWNNIVG